MGQHADRLGIFQVCTFPENFEMTLVSGANITLFLHSVVPALPTIHHGFLAMKNCAMASHDVTVIGAVAGCHCALE